MRYMTPDTPGTRSLESPAMKGEKMAKDAEMSPAEAVLSKMKANTPSATPTLTPSPTKMPHQATATTTKKPARRAIRTYGKKRTHPDETNDTQSSKRPKTATTAPLPITPAPMTTPTPRDSVADEVSRQLQKEAAEAESRNNRRPQTPVKSNPKTTACKAVTPPRKAVSPRRVGIMRYFQPAARIAPPPPPPTLPEPCSPAASISSMSSLSSCPSPSSSIGSFQSRASSLQPSPSAKSVYSLDESASTTDDPESPPASPLWQPVEQKPRQKRRLTIRPDRQVAAAKDDDDAKGDNEKKQEPEVDEETKENIPIAPSFGSSMMAASSTRMRMRLGLSSGPSSTTSSTTNKKRKKLSGPPSVQTTLSLAVAPRNGSMSDSASVRECKECNILYNPLHEKDAKFHTRYHASVCRKQQKEQKEQKSLDLNESSAVASAAAGVRLR